MAAAPLTIVTRTQGNNRAVKDGSVPVERTRVEFVEVPVLVQGFRRMVRTLEFDVCEMALTTYLCAREHGVRFTALPVFLVRGFHHGAIIVRPGGGIEQPKDLAGRRVGVNRGYTVTTGVWARGVLEQEYGLDPDGVTWVLSGDEHVADYRPPANVVPMPEGGDLATLLAADDLAATIGVELPPSAGVPLIPDPDEAGFAALRDRGHYPINHLVVVRDDVLADDPDVAARLFEAFAESKRRYVAALTAPGFEAASATDAMYRRVFEITGEDPLPYGVEPNRAVLEELVGHALRQHILTRPPDLDGLFAPATRGLVG